MTDNLKPGKFVCPSGFEEVEGHSDLHLEDLEDEDTELWIVQAPIGMDMTKLENHPINLQGLTKVSYNGDNMPKLECFASEYTENEHPFHIVVPRKSNNKLCYVPKPFKRQVVITECIDAPNLKFPTALKPYALVETDSENEDAVQNNVTPETLGTPKKGKKRKAVESSATIELMNTDENENVSVKETKRKHKKRNRNAGDSPRGPLLDSSTVKMEPIRFEASSSVAETGPGFQTLNDDEERPRKKKKHKRKETNSESMNSKEFPNVEIKADPDHEAYNNSKNASFDKSGEIPQVQNWGEEESTPEEGKKKNKHKKKLDKFINVDIKVEAIELVRSMSENLSTSKKAKKKKMREAD